MEMLLGGGDIYALAENDGDTYFNVVDKDVTIPEGKCYLKIDQTALARLEFVFGVADAIEIPDAGVADNSTYYTLSGQRVHRPQSGIYILNNRKVLVK